MTQSLYDLTSPDVAALIDSKPVAVLPLGSVEQHGPHLPCGTDSMASELISRELARRLGALHVPFCPYGVTPIHAGHPGTISLHRRTFEALLENVCRELIEMGVRVVIFVNWHEGNTASINAVATDLQAETGASIFVAQACYVAQRLYADQGGALTHGGGIETMAVMAHDGSLVKAERVSRAAPSVEASAADEMRRSHEVYGFITDVREIAQEGWHGDPGWATGERAGTFVETVCEEIVTRLDSIGALEVRT